MHKDALPTQSAQEHKELEALNQACFQAYPESAVCVQSPVGSRNSAIYNVYHTSLRPSSLFEPRHPSLTTPKVNSRIDAELATMASRGNRVIPNFG